ncbi:MAG: VOC family protein [Oscillospiraceae bacterium]|nr:VOC family protein [Oscillospiraceae bacterium]
MRFGSVYLVVRDFDKSVSFYEKVLDMKVSAVNGKRFAMFNNEGLNLCLMSGYYDDQNRSRVITKDDYWEVYDNQSKIADSANNRKVFINLGVEDLRAEYERIKGLGIAEQLTPIRYIEVFSPYWYFTFMDPDGNPIEIAGGYTEI